MYDIYLHYPVVYLSFHIILKVEAYFPSQILILNITFINDVSLFSQWMNFRIRASEASAKAPSDGVEPTGSSEIFTKT